MRHEANQRTTTQHTRTMRDLARLDQGALASPEIRAARELTENQMHRALQNSGSFLNVEKVICLVFESDASGARTFLAAMLTALNCEIETVDIAILYLIEDIWDYFPHRFLQGRCPAEVESALFRDQLSQG
jgi:hypothetical protein